MHERLRTRRLHPRTPWVAMLGLALAFVSGAAWAADAKLDEANASTAKAIALLKASESSPAAEIEAHRKKAIDLLTRAQGEILKAKGE
ncbi:MAG TPA: hypothetical protein VGQ57_13570 [Polyangiaceae bacterium]|jgi:hypothetical protein|nr:hypothetical protein [Polyangiaceae bacterium]